MKRLLRSEAVMGTVFTFDVRGERTARGGPRAAAVEAVEEAVRWLHWVDGTFSTYRDASEVSLFDRGDLDLGSCSRPLRSVMSLCHTMWEMTAGYFDAWAGGHFDPSGVVKGWSIERASAMLVAAGWPDHAIDGGGDVRLSGDPGTGSPWQVGVRHPLQVGSYCAALSLDEGAVATSGTYERGHHVIDPRTGEPARQLASVTVHRARSHDH